MYIFWFLHQTTTLLSQYMLPKCCISFDSYIKPQRGYLFGYLFGVVYLLIPTSNHNLLCIHWVIKKLYIFWFLHQTTTYIIKQMIMGTLYIFWFLHQTTTQWVHWKTVESCISFDSYIKPQHRVQVIWIYIVVYLLIPTSNHNLVDAIHMAEMLYIFWFLHQTTTGLTIFAP